MPTYQWPNFVDVSIGGPGPPGLDGVDGVDGQDGAPGPPGAQGTPGSAGANGSPGAPGLQGPIGPPGLDGADGIDGSDGVPGPAGPAGTTGSSGAAGIQGPPGLDGADGEEGYGWPGPQGIQGPAGAQGPAGLAPVMGTVISELAATVQRSGRFTIELPVLLRQSQIGGPVIVMQASGRSAGAGACGIGYVGDEAEWDPIICAAEVQSTKRILVRWTTRGLVRGKRRFHYLVAA